MAIEMQIEKKLIEQLSMEDSQWTYRPDLHTEEAYGTTSDPFWRPTIKISLRGFPFQIRNSKGLRTR